MLGLQVADRAHRPLLLAMIQTDQVADGRSCEPDYAVELCIFLLNCYLYALTYCKVGVFVLEIKGTVLSVVLTANW